MSYRYQEHATREAAQSKSQFDELKAQHSDKAGIQTQKELEEAQRQWETKHQNLLKSRDAMRDALETLRTSHDRLLCDVARLQNDNATLTTSQASEAALRAKKVCDEPSCTWARDSLSLCLRQLFPLVSSF